MPTESSDDGISVAQRLCVPFNMTSLSHTPRPSSLLPPYTSPTCTCAQYKYKPIIIIQLIQPIMIISAYVRLPERRDLLAKVEKRPLTRISW